jgi:hypothetical protein
LPAILLSKNRRDIAENAMKKPSQASAPPTLDYRRPTTLMSGHHRQQGRRRSVGGTLESRRSGVVFDEYEDRSSGCLPCRNLAGLLTGCCGGRETEAKRRARRLGDDFVGKARHSSP